MNDRANGKAAKSPGFARKEHGRRSEGETESIPLKFVFISSCYEVWGGSEELWGGAAVHLAQQGHRVCALKNNVDFSHAAIERLRRSGCQVQELGPDRSKMGRYVHRALPGRWRSYAAKKQFRQFVSTFRPDLMVVAQAENFDGFVYAQLCQELDLPYAIVSQKAMNHVWPADDIVEQVRSALLAARKSYFVSQHNRTLTEEQIGQRLENAEVVHNPFLVPYDTPLPWPEGDTDSLRLACVGRLYLHDKGQDILLRVLAQEKWRQRRLHVSFFGRGMNHEGLVALAKYLDVENITFRGFVEDVTQIWGKHHALVLPSRSEGLPLALIEAMLCGRVAIATDVGGNGEVIKDGVTGFLASAPTERHLDEALERAWQQRGEWREVGRRASENIRRIVPEDPTRVFADNIARLAHQVGVAGKKNGL